MTTIIATPIFHKQKEWIALRFEKNIPLQQLIRKEAGALWTQTHGCWYIPMGRSNYQQLCDALKDVAVIDDRALKSHLVEQKNKDRKVAGSLVGDKLVYKEKLIHPTNAHVLPDMREQMILKAYSPSTIKTYLNEVGRFLQILKGNNADGISIGRLKKYLQYCFETLGLSENTLHSSINALKFYYEQVLHKEKFFWEVPRPKKQLILPKVLSVAEVGRLFMSITNLKHKAILFTAYSAGLRVSEVVNLRIQDIDSSRMTMFIEKAKGKKDRIVNLSPILLDILRAYIKQSNPRPRVYLFESSALGEPYSARSAQIVFSDARKRAGINKKVSFHSLRHSFATHLLEKGVDIRYIKDILGHFSIKTTERYTHVSRRTLVNIVSPLDDLFTKEIL